MIKAEYNVNAEYGKQMIAVLTRKNDQVNDPHWVQALKLSRKHDYHALNYGDCRLQLVLCLILVPKTALNQFSN